VDDYGEYKKWLIDYEMSQQNGVTKFFQKVKSIFNKNTNIAYEEAVTVAEQKIKNQNNYWDDKRYQDYKKWLGNKYDLRGDKTQDMIKDLLTQGRNVYLLTPTVTPYWERTFITEPVKDVAVNQFFKKIVEVK
jgi:hypothetical protein